MFFIHNYFATGLLEPSIHNRVYFTFTYSAVILHNVNEYNAELWNGPNN